MKILHITTGMRKTTDTSGLCGELCNELVSVGHDVFLETASLMEDDGYAINGNVWRILIDDVIVPTTRCGYARLSVGVGFPLALVLFFMSYTCARILPKWMKG